MGFNSILLKGYVVSQCPDVVSFSNGGTVVKFALSVRDLFLHDKQDNAKKHVSFFDCDYWFSEKTSQYLQSELLKLEKGSYIAFEARPVQERWEQEDGQKRSKIKFSVSGFIDTLHHVGGNLKPKEAEGSDNEVPF